MRTARRKAGRALVVIPGLCPLLLASTQKLGLEVPGDSVSCDEYHPFTGSLHSKEEEWLEDNFLVLTLASGRKEGPDLETVSSQWQPESEQGENSAKQPEEEQMLGHLRGLTGVEEEGGNRPLCCDPEHERMKRKQPEGDQETTQEAVCCGAASSHYASGGAWLPEVFGRVRATEKDACGYLTAPEVLTKRNHEVGGVLCLACQGRG
ncbi:hypothetical protein NDU88_007057 [Pleurodeles waltl]|uniref:Uncharacterized protein n=1 Tax=Pleurodeles waltl TaxID=8319 RepID=A0AAV7UPD9_PLEWA|nr:hypothetical protein NDU88_007057 [Pleurodeles waltl]